MFVGLMSCGLLSAILGSFIGIVLGAILTSKEKGDDDGG